jgi:chromosome partitioning protein
MAVVLVDADPQAHATNCMNLPEKPMLYDLLIRDANWQDSMLPAPGYGKLWIVPGNIETRGIPLHLSDAFKLDMRLRQLEGIVDVVVIDTPPTPSALQTMVYLATTDLIYPSQAQALSLDGLAESVKRLQGLNKTRTLMGVAAVNLLGVVPTMVKPNTTAHQHGLKLIAKHFGEALTLPAITERTVWRDREYAKQPIFAYAPESEAAYEMWALIDAVSTKMAVAHG